MGRVAHSRSGQYRRGRVGGEDLPLGRHEGSWEDEQREIEVGHSRLDLDQAGPKGGGEAVCLERHGRGEVKRKFADGRLAKRPYGDLFRHGFLQDSEEPLTIRFLVGRGFTFPQAPLESIQ